MRVNHRDTEKKQTETKWAATYLAKPTACAPWVSAFSSLLCLSPWGTRFSLFVQRLKYLFQPRILLPGPVLQDDLAPLFPALLE
jgi:hypothetical protein